jgi:glycosyltransferase involved in cell wall biosynthesis
MVSPEYPPINGGVGRYTFNLVRELKTQGADVYVACGKQGKGDFVGLSPTNTHNSEILLSFIDKIKPDIVHIQYEPGLYGLKMDSYKPSKIQTTIDLFYEKCTIPIVTTFHSGYTLRQWMRIPEIILNKKESLSVQVKDTKTHTLLSNIKNRLDCISTYWKYLANYGTFQNQNRNKMLKSNVGIVFSDYMKDIINAKSDNKNNGSRKKACVIYHGAEPAISIQRINKSEARSRFQSIPQGINNKIALAFGFMTVAKGWDILEKMKVPENWTIVVNSSINHSTGERIQLDSLANKKANHIINLNQDYLSEEDLSALFYASDAVLLPYKISSGSGVMFDALGHGIPFISSDLPFFNEFAAKGLGITAKRTPNAFTYALIELDKNYDKYKNAIEGFKKNLRWNIIASTHIKLYRDILKPTKILRTTAATTVNSPQDQTSKLL